MPVANPTAENLVGIHPHKAAVLASALRHAARQFFDHSTLTFSALVEGMEDPGLAVALCDATGWFDVQGRALQRTLDELVRELAAGPLDSTGSGGWGQWSGIDVWSQPYASSFDDPDGAARAAGDAAALVPALVASSDTDPAAAERLRTVLQSWAGNEVFAIELARHLMAAEELGVGAVGQLLQLDAEWRRRGAEDAGAAGVGARHLVLRTLATASRMGWLGFRFDELRREVQGGDEPITAANARSLIPLGVLFSADTAWGSEFLLDAVDGFVRPVNRAYPKGEIVFQDNGFDPRDAVLGAVARDPGAATTLLARAGVFDDLFAARFGYADGGVALAAVLQAGTRPVATTDVRGAVAPTPAASPSTPTPEADRVTPQAMNMMQFVWWVVRHPDLPPQTRARLGVVTAPWIASFRKDTYDEHATTADPMGNPLAALADGARTDYLDYVADDLLALADLRLAELAWVRQSFTGIGGPPFDARGIGLISNVDHRTSRAVRNGLLRNLDREDAQINFDKEVWSFLVSIITLPMKDYLDFAVDTGVHLVGELARPTSTMALDYARAFPTAIEADRRKLEWILVSTLWDERAHNHVFDGVAEPPASIVFGEPRRFLALTDMNDAQFQAWLGWVDANDLRRRGHWEQLTVGPDG